LTQSIKIFLFLLPGAVSHSITKSCRNQLNASSNSCNYRMISFRHIKLFRVLHG
jgi:hypothetical protein